MIHMDKMLGAPLEDAPANMELDILRTLAEFKR